MRIECTTLLTLKEVGEMIKKIDERSIIKWLENKNIGIWSKRPSMVYQFEVELAIQLEIVESLKKQYGEKWHIIYEAAAVDGEIKRAVFALHPKPNIYQAKSQIVNSVKTKIKQRIR